jgi:crotonobetaine/carnitine-CoA ligase
VRFGIERSYSFFNMTEISSPLVRPPGHANDASCGRPRPGVEVRIVDEHDAEVDVGGVGELIVRTERAWEMNSGYVNMPEATAEAWRNGWFHTGDLFRRDELGDYFYVDRRKDAVRRNGENISSFEVEAEICTFPPVAECAVVAVPDERVGEEIRAFVVPRPGATFEAGALIDHLAPRLARFMLPRYVTVTESLPRNASGKVQKHLLRELALGPATWDRRAPERT